jgi:hypothetical protein
MFKRCAIVFLVACGALLSFSGAAVADAAAPGWTVTGRFAPTVLKPGGEGLLFLYVYDVGSVNGSGTVTVTDTLPPGLVAKEAFPTLISNGSEPFRLFNGGIPCLGSARVVTCIVPAAGISTQPQTIEIPVAVEADAEAAGEAGANRVSITGGGALGAAGASIPARFGSEPAGFGLSKLDAWFTNSDGTVDTQAGSHPYEATVAFAVNTTGFGPDSEPPAGGEVAAVDVSLPPGLVGNPNAVPQCTRSELDNESGGCPPGSQVGEDYALISNGDGFWYVGNVYNMVPPAGVAAEFGFGFGGIITLLDARVRAGGDGGITEHSNVAQRAIDFNSLRLWGYPAEHNGTELPGVPPAPFLTLPTSCGEPAGFSIEALGTWRDLHATAPVTSAAYENNEGTPTGFTGCERLSHFEPTVTSLTPDTSFSDTAAGLEAKVRVPQGLSPEELATSGLKEVSVTLPEGVSVNPGQASGLQACSLAEAGVGSNSEADDGPPGCPAASRIGSDEIETPILKDRLRGSIYLLQSNPPDLEILLAASGDGANVKAVGHVRLDETTGRVVTTFNGTRLFPGLPDDPVSEFDLTFNGGAQAAIVTPATCGTYTSDGVFTPQASPFIEGFPGQASFQITSGPNSSGPGACTGPLPFTPSVTAGSTTELAGGFTGLSFLLQRADGQQRVSSLQVKAPGGLLGLVKSVPLCGEPQAAQGTCSAASQIGHTVVAAGPGSDPLYLPQPGQPEAPVYLTGPYEGAPYGLSVVVPVVAGPFDLGTQVVRSRVEVDPHTAQLTVRTDPFPTILKGVPADLRTISVVVDRPGFLFNPTSCEPQTLTGSVRSTEGAVSAFSNHFQVGGCAALPFKPTFAVSTPAKTSKQKGAGLLVTVGSGAGQANIAKAAVSLPKQLPSRLTTIQQACREATFDANPASCPAGSDIGTGTVTTPILANPLTGPVYLVSHGGAAFPDIVVILQGEGVTLDLTGSIDIKGAITSSTFATVPDAPVTSFQLSLPEGPHSALATNIPAKAKGSLCGQSLVMPTTLTGQNGAVVKQSTKIAVTGCPKAKKKVKAKKHTQRAHGKKAKRGKKKG